MMGSRGMARDGGDFNSQGRGSRGMANFNSGGPSSRGGRGMNHDSRNNGDFGGHHQPGRRSYNQDYPSDRQEQQRHSPTADKVTEEVPLKQADNDDSMEIIRKGSRK